MLIFPRTNVRVHGETKKKKIVAGSNPHGAAPYEEFFSWAVATAALLKSALLLRARVLASAD